MTKDWKAVAAAVSQRLLELDLELRELAHRSGVSESTLRELRYNTVERGRSMRTLASVSAGLQWPADHLQRVLEGTHPPGEPPAADPVALRLDALERKLDEVLSLLRRNSVDDSEVPPPDPGERDAGR